MHAGKKKEWGASKKRQSHPLSLVCKLPFGGNWFGFPQILLPQAVFYLPFSLWPRGATSPLLSLLEQAWAMSKSPKRLMVSTEPEGMLLVAKRPGPGGGCRWGAVVPWQWWSEGRWARGGFDKGPNPPLSLIPSVINNGVIRFKGDAFWALSLWSRFKQCKMTCKTIFRCFYSTACFLSLLSFHKISLLYALECKIFEL